MSLSFFSVPRSVRVHPSIAPSWSTLHQCIETIHAYATQVHHSSSLSLSSLSSSVLNEFIQLSLCLTSRASLPIALHTAMQLIHTLSLAQHNQLPTSVVSSSFSLLLLRFVNILVDSQQLGQSALSVRMLGKQMNLSNTLIELRHAATHGNMYDHSTLELCVRDAMAWIDKYYVHQQLKEINSVAFLTYSYLTQIRKYLTDQYTTTQRRKENNHYNRESDSSGLNDACVSYLNTLIEYMSVNHHTQSQILIPLLFSLSTNDILTVLGPSVASLQHSSVKSVFCFSLPSSFNRTDPKFTFTPSKVSLVFSKSYERYLPAIKHFEQHNQSNTNKIDSFTVMVENGFLSSSLRYFIRLLYQQRHEYEQCLMNTNNIASSIRLDKENEYAWRIELISLWFKSFLHLFSSFYHSSSLSLSSLPILLSFYTQLLSLVSAAENELHQYQSIHERELKAFDESVQEIERVIIQHIKTATDSLSVLHNNDERNPAKKQHEENYSLLINALEKSNDAKKAIPTSNDPPVSSLLSSLSKPSSTFSSSSSLSMKRTRFTLMNDEEWNVLHFTTPIGRVRGQNIIEKQINLKKTTQFNAEMQETQQDENEEQRDQPMEEEKYNRSEISSFIEQDKKQEQKTKQKTKTQQQQPSQAQASTTHTANNTNPLSTSTNTSSSSTSSSSTTSSSVSSSSPPDKKKKKKKNKKKSSSSSSSSSSSLDLSFADDLNDDSDSSMPELKKVDENDFIELDEQQEQEIERFRQTLQAAAINKNNKELEEKHKKESSIADVSITAPSSYEKNGEEGGTEEEEEEERERENVSTDFTHSSLQQLIDEKLAGLKEWEQQEKKNDRKNEEINEHTEREEQEEEEEEQETSAVIPRSIVEAALSNVFKHHVVSSSSSSVSCFECKALRARVDELELFKEKYLSFEPLLLSLQEKERSMETMREQMESFMRTENERAVLLEKEQKLFITTQTNEKSMIQQTLLQQKQSLTTSLQQQQMNTSEQLRIATEHIAKLERKINALEALVTNSN